MHVNPEQVEIIRVRREQGPADWFYATSPTLKGLFVCEPTLDALDEAIPRSISDLYFAIGRKVVVSPASDDGQALRAWVVIPTHGSTSMEAAD